MAEHKTPLHDGRFGEKFDDEINVKSVLWVAVGLAVATVIGFLIAHETFRVSKNLTAKTVTPPSPIEIGAERPIPDGPLLQAHPEAELLEMRREMAKSLHGYGWVDEGAGIVHIPIEKAIDLALEEHLVKTAEGDEAP